MSGRRGSKPKPIRLNASVQLDRPSSAKCKACSDRIIQLALPNLHIVSSVLKEHFKTLSREHVERLEKLLNQIKTTKSCSSQISFVENFNDFKDCDRKTIMDVLNGVHTKEKIQTEWKNFKFLPIKSSSDTFLLTLDRKKYSSTKSDKSSTDSSTNLGTYKGVFKKAIESMNFNYKETVYIKLEGIKSKTEQNSILVQTDNMENGYCEACSKGNHEIKVLYLQNPIKKKPKLRQLHTLLEGSDFLTDLETVTEKFKCDKYIQASEPLILREDIELTIQHLRKFYLVLLMYMNLCLNLPVKSIEYSFEQFSKLMNYSVNLSMFLCHVFSNGSKEIFDYIKFFLNDLKTQYRSMQDNEKVVQDEIKEGEKKKKKRKCYYMEGYHLSNLSSIVH